MKARERPRKIQTPSLSTLAHAANAFIFTYDVHKRCIVASSDNSIEILGAAHSEIGREGNLFLRYVHPKDRFSILSKLEESLSGLSPYRATYRWERPDNREILWLQCRARLRNDKKSAVFEGIIFEAMHADHGDTMLEQFVSSLDSSVIAIDSDLFVIFENGVARKKGFTFGDPAFEFDSLVQGQPLEKAFRSKERWLEMQERLKNCFSKGTVHWGTIKCDEKIFEVETTVFTDEENEPRLFMRADDKRGAVRAQKYLSDLSKAQAYQQISVGVTHHMNNSLQAMIGELRILTSLTPSHADQNIHIDRILKLAQRTATLTQELLSIGGDALVPIDANLCIMQAIGLIQDKLPLESELDVAFSTHSVCLGNADLLRNAIRDILLFLWTAVTPPQKTLVHTVAFDDGTGSKLSVNIDIEFPKGMLPPEFLSVESVSPSPFTVTSVEQWKIRYLAIFERVTETEKLSPAHVKHAPLILIVDDEILVGQALCGVLSEQSFHAVYAQSAREAIKILRETPSVKVVLTDACMPDIRGDTLIRKIRRKFPWISVIGFSGSPSELRPLSEAGAVEVLQKPVDPTLLKQVVERYMPQAVGVS